ncbi:MAG: ABC transporter permease [Methanomassiliicoccales archaeon]|nr:ABC transporter permease [Methanomassiliicoccales archaeon]
MIRETWALTVRELKHWYRVKMQIFVTLIQPIVWLGLFGQAFNLNALLPPGTPPAAIENLFAGATNYFSYMAVGMLAVNVLFTCMFGGMSIVWDRRFGFLNKLRAAPIPRSAIALSRILATSFRAIVQMTIVLVIALAFVYVPGLTGLTVNPGFNAIDLLGLFVVMSLLAVMFASMFTAIALKVENQETLFGIVNLLNLPLMFASAALFPTSFMPNWLKDVANYNPLTLAVDAARQFMFHTANPIYDVGVDLIGLFVIAVLFLVISILVARRTMSAK